MESAAPIPVSGSGVFQPPPSCVLPLDFGRLRAQVAAYLRPEDVGRIEAAYHFAAPPPVHVGEYARFLHSPCHFWSGENRVVIPLSVLAQPNPFRDKALYRQALSQCEQLEQEQQVTVADWRQRILHLLRQHPGKLWTLAELAGYFHVSGRTLIRYLKAEGVSYQQLLDQELARQALDLLQIERHTVESVALALGYQDATAFRRALQALVWRAAVSLCPR